MAVIGDELYFRGDSNREGSVRLLTIADLNGDGFLDAKLQWLVGGRWLDVMVGNAVPASVVFRDDGVSVQDVLNSLASGGGGAVAASSVVFTPVGNVSATTVQAAVAEVDAEKVAIGAAATNLATSAVPGQTTVEGALTALQASKAVAGAAIPESQVTNLVADLAAKADAAATTTALAGKLPLAQAIPESQVTGLVADLAAHTASLALKQDKTPTASVDANSQRIINVATPTASTDAVTKAYADALAMGLTNAKTACLAATTANITLSGAQTIDGVSVVATNRVLVKNQTTPAQNGIYVAAAGAWARATDMDVWAETQGAYTLVTGGTTQANTGWVSQTAAGGTLETTAITFAQFSGGSSVTSVFTRTGAVVAASGDYTAAQITGISAYAQTVLDDADAATARTTLGLGSMATQAASAVAVTGGSVTGITDLTVADGGTGASDAATARTNLGLGSMATQAAGAVAITGGTIAGITDLPVADGGTGASTAAAARTNLGLGTAAVANTPASGNAASTEVVLGSDTRLAGAVTSATATSTAAGAPATALTTTQAQIGTTVTITPQSTSSKVLLIARLDVTKDATVTKRTVTARLWRGAVTTGVQVGQDAVESSAATGEQFPAVILAIDSPASVAAQTYRLSAAGDVTTTLTAARYELQAIELLNAVSVTEALTAGGLYARTAGAWAELQLGELAFRDAVSKDHVEDDLGMWTPDRTPQIQPFLSTWNPDLGNTYSAVMTLVAAFTLGAPVNLTPGQEYVLRFIQDGTGGRAITANAAYKGFPANTGNTLNKELIVKLYATSTTTATVISSTGWI